MHASPSAIEPLAADRPPEAPPDVSVIVVNYNGLAFLPRLMASLERAFVRYRHETIVVDNASTDGSVAWLRRRQDIVLMEMARNYGFTGGNNIGAAHARGQVLLLLNNDTAFDEPLDGLIDAALLPQIGAAGCRLVYGDGRLQLSIGLEHTPWRIVLSWLGLERAPGAPSWLRKFETDPTVYERTCTTVDWVSGACLATRREVWARLGGLDDRFFMYCEDVDYGARVRAAGWRVAYVSHPTVTHFEGGGKPWVGRAALLRTVRSYLILTGKHHGRWGVHCLAAALAGVFAARWAWFSVRRPQDEPARARLAHDKALGFRDAAASMARAARSGLPPPLP